MAKSYDVVVLAAPANPAAATAAGGSLTAGTTYYYKVQALNTTNGAGVTQISAESAEVSATPDAVNKTINLTWDAVAGAACYRVFRTTTSGDYNTDAVHFVRSAASIYYSSTANSFSDTGALSVIKLPLKEMIQVRAWGGDASDPITSKDIYDYLSGAGYTQALISTFDYTGGENKVAFVGLRASLQLGVNASGSTTAAVFKIPVGSIFFVEGRFRTYTTCTVLMGERVVSATNGDYGRYGCVLMTKSLAYFGGGSHFILGIPKIYDSMIKNNDSTILNMYASDDQFVLSGAASADGELFQSILSGAGGNSYFSGDLTVEDSNVFAPMRVESDAAGTPVFENVNAIANAFPFLIFNSATTAVTFRNVKLVSRGALTADLYFHRGGTTAGVGTLIDCEFVSDPPRGRIASNPTYMTWERKHTVNINVRKPDGTALEGATVTLDRDTGDEAFSTTTDASGDITAQEVLTNIYAGKAGTSGTEGGDGVAYTETNYNDLTLTIEKDGYETVTNTITIREKTTLNYTLKTQITKLEDDNGNVFDRVDKTNSGTTNLRRKLTKVM